MACVDASAVSDLHSAAGLVGVAGPDVRLQGRRVARPAARGRSAAPVEPEATVELERPGIGRCTESSACPGRPPPSTHHTRDTVALAPEADLQALDVPASPRPAANRRCACRVPIVGPLPERLCGVVGFVDESAEDGVAVHGGDFGFVGERLWAGWLELLSALGPLGVVVLDVLGDHRVQMPATED